MTMEQLIAKLNSDDKMGGFVSTYYERLCRFKDRADYELISGFLLGLYAMDYISAAKHSQLEAEIFKIIYPTSEVV